ncbi:MAG: peptide deformylase [Planctomycetota bacterium]
MSAPLDFRVVYYPDPVLRKVAKPVEAFDDELRATVAAMFDLMYRAEGCGLAAPQTGLERRILVLNPTGDPAQKEHELALVNVTIVERSGPMTLHDEGCLSFPQMYAEIKRPERCRVVAYDPSGNKIETEYAGFLARVVQHEYDHLEGVLLVDRMSPADKARNKAALAELVDTYRRSQSAGAR